MSKVSQAAVIRPPLGFGLRLEDSVLQLAVAELTARGDYTVAIDAVHADAGQRFLGGDDDALVSAVESLVEKHSLRRAPIAVSLDGDFCVTRVMSGPPEVVAKDVDMLSDRVHRYLKLGPGKKVTGGTQTTLDAGTNYAAIGVVNENVIDRLYRTFRKLNLSIRWIEPSLFSLARLVGRDPRWDEQAVMIADGTGNRWDIGIAGGGRLWLDYRPANADSPEAIVEVLDDHLGRLQRFCKRHRRLQSGTISQLLICGSSDAAGHAVEILRGLRGIEAEAITLATDDTLIANAAEIPNSRIPVVAAVLPTLMGEDVSQVPDLLAQIREAPRLTWRRRVFALGAPVLAASLVAAISVSWHAWEAGRLGNVRDDSIGLSQELTATSATTDQLASQRRKLTFMESIASQTQLRDWPTITAQVSRCLPPSVKLTTWTVDGTGDLTLEGESLDDSLLYEIIGYLNNVPGVTQVALRSTEPTEDQTGSRFVIALSFVRPDADAEADPYAQIPRERSWPDRPNASEGLPS